jgi:hypothetical protein
VALTPAPVDARGYFSGSSVTMMIRFHSAAIWRDRRRVVDNRAATAGHRHGTVQDLCDLGRAGGADRHQPGV